MQIIDIPTKRKIDARLTELEAERQTLMALRRAAAARERVLRGKPIVASGTTDEQRQT